MNYRTILITSFYLFFFSTQIIGAEVGIRDNIKIGFIQDSKGRKWLVFQDKNNMFAHLENEKVKVANYIPCITPQLVPLSNYIYVLHLIEGHTIKIGEMVSSEKRLEEAPTIYK